MSTSSDARLNAQRQALQQGQLGLPVTKPCRVGDGILVLSEAQHAHYQQVARQNAQPLQIFVPASGSGSRMFAFLYDYLQFQDPESTQQAERFFGRLPEFALFRCLPKNMQDAYDAGSLTLANLVAYLLDPETLNFGQAPKGLVPFHIHEPFILNPFQEHLLQAQALNIGPLSFHFTIQADYQEAFQKSISAIAGLSAQEYEVTYSTQDPNTDAFVFDAEGQVCLQPDGQALRRPAGHGTLLQNLEKLQAPYILVRNIDNVQHYTQMQAATNTWQLLLGLQIEIRRQLLGFLQTNDFNGLLSWNQTFELFDPVALANASQNWQELIQRPLRVCGMVRNDGQPGGGPFFVEKGGQLSKQIVEKAQLVNHPDASALLLQSSHFNPVFMVLSPCDLHGVAHDLEQFKDPDTYFVVDKTQQGKRVRFIEQPGLWNGAMAYWNTLFVEIPSTAFSPVKTVLDLLEKAHIKN